MNSDLVEWDMQMNSEIEQMVEVWGVVVYGEGYSKPDREGVVFT